VDEAEAEDVLAGLERADEIHGEAQRLARTYLVERGVLDQTNRDLRLLVREAASAQRAGK
jgi:hypothetical protein